jgi:hypothetical protein
MANLTSVQIKDSYQSVLTTSETTSNPTTGTLQNGKGTAITALTVSGALTLTGDLTVDTSTLKVDSANDRVGIGTITPATKLDVRGTSGTIIQAKDSSAFCGVVIDAGAASTPFTRLSVNAVGKFEMGYFNSLYYLNNTTGVNDTGAAMVITSTNNVGIGATSPVAKLTVYGGDGTNSTVNLSGGSTGGDNATIASNYNLIFQVDANNNVGNRAFQWRYGGKGYSDGTSLMALDANGLGIGLIPTSRNNTRLQIVDGIGFPATQVASADANTLDDYEEGTFTPTASSGITINTINNATYTKIGNTVTFQIWIKVDIGSADFVIAGLPFTGSGRTAGSMSNTSEKETIANLIINNEIYGFAATTVLDDDLLIGGVYRVA